MIFIGAFVFFLALAGLEALFLYKVVKRRAAAPPNVIPDRPLRGRDIFLLKDGPGDHPFEAIEFDGTAESAKAIEKMLHPAVVQSDWSGNTGSVLRLETAKYGARIVRIGDVVSVPLPMVPDEYAAYQAFHVMSGQNFRRLFKPELKEFL